MQIVSQSIDDLTTSLSTLESAWQDEHATKVITLIQGIPIKTTFTLSDIGGLFDTDFHAAFTACQLFLGISKDEFQDRLGANLGPSNIGRKAFSADRGRYLAALDSLQLPAAMAAAVNFKPAWSDLLIERLRSGRGKAIKGQKRGRGLEDFAEAIVRDVFGASFDTRCQFSGVKGRSAKCDFAIPNRHDPRILIESKGYGATGSKMTDIVGDANKIIEAKRPDVPFLLITDGITWMRRLADLRKLIELQHAGAITRIYTTKMAGQLRDDLKTLKAELKIQ